MSFTLLLQDEAIRDMQDAYDWYEDQLVNLGEEFLEELHAVLDKLKQRPTQYGFYFDEFRTVRLKRFPYLIVYKIQGAKVFINSIRHIKRKPRF